jgi:hypothetical protein
VATVSDYLKEPWTADGCVIETDLDADVALTGSCGSWIFAPDEHPDVQEANARRIVAVVNAFAGWPTERIEEATKDDGFEIVVLHGGAGLQDSARRQRERLEEATVLLALALGLLPFDRKVTSLPDRIVAFLDEGQK